MYWNGRSASVQLDIGYSLLLIPLDEFLVVNQSQLFKEMSG